MQCAIFIVSYNGSGESNFKTMEETFCDKVVLNSGNSDTLELLIAVMMEIGAMYHTEQMGETEREAERERRACVRKCFSFFIYPWRSGPGKRVECTLLLFSSIRLRAWRIARSPSPQWIIPPTLLSPRTTTSRQPSNTYSL